MGMGHRPQCASFSLFLSFRKKRIKPVFRLLQKYHSFVDTLVLKTSIVLKAKRLNFFNTTVFLKTEVFLECFKNMELPNGAFVFWIKGKSKKISSVSNLSHGYSMHDSFQGNFTDIEKCGHLFSLCYFLDEYDLVLCSSFLPFSPWC
jgi:hypothetical protein